MLGRVRCFLPLNSGKNLCFGLAFHTILTLRASWYAPPDTGVPNLQLVALEYLQSIEGAGRICWSAPFCGIGFLYLQAPMPSPMRGRWHGEAVTDEVEHLQRCGAVYLISQPSADSFPS